MDPGKVIEKPQIAYFGPDACEPSQIRMIGACRDAGYRVVSCAFLRSPASHALPDVVLGPAPHGIGPGRFLAILRGLMTVLRQRRRLTKADIVVARNLDMALLALVAFCLGGRRARFIYQCFDIHDLMTGTGLASMLARWVERLVLTQTDILAVTSPRFVTDYFRQRQGFSGQVNLMENRIAWPAFRGPMRPSGTDSIRNGPLVLGWVGTLRCRPSLKLLTAVAEEFGPAVEVQMHGLVHRHVLSDFDDIVAAHANITYAGPYAYPDDLARIYGSLDLVWAQDLWQPAGNSTWLLPNRLYEAGYFGCPVVAVAGTATADWVLENGTGFVVQAEEFTDFLKRQRPDALRRFRQHILSLPATLFCLDAAQVHRMLGADDKVSTVRDTDARAA